ncbi:S-adenosyl-L-methionine-dependent methyltransferase [Irpex lacteus]|nr:S-adenosyl-L-methionine-dependent methyltransferase [Irpex lacteus]
MAVMGAPARRMIQRNNMKRLSLRLISVDSPVAELRALSDIIKTSVDRIEALCAERGQTFPLSDLPFTPQSECPNKPGAAAAQLLAAVRPPSLSLVTHAVQYHVSSCIRVAVRLHVAEILRAAGLRYMLSVNPVTPRGLYPVLLGNACGSLQIGSSPSSVGNKHIFKEVAPDTFTNNRLSSLMDTGKDITDILSNPEAKHDNTPGLAALLEHATDGAFCSSYYLSDVLLDSKWSHSAEPNETALNMAFKTSLPGFEWRGLPENEYKRKLFGIGMRGLQGNPDVVLDGFEWKNLSPGSVIVDVGGGIGSKMLPLAKAFDRLNFVIQDRKNIMGNATEFWSVNMPEALSSGRIQIQAHDFFTAQPIEKPAVFFLYAYCIKILTLLRKAAGPSTQLIIMDNIISYASPQCTIQEGIPGETISIPPEPLLPNWGEANIMPYLADMQMLTALNGSERTVAQYNRLLEASGWKLARVYTGEGFQSQDSKLISIPDA